MSNSVYSIVLNDEVVDVIDNMAYQLGMNRSSMINQILAEKVAYITPEQKIKNILGSVERLINDNDVFQILMGTGDNSLSIKSPFKYKYNPSVKYSVVLNKGGNKAKGELRVSMRTQNPTLISELNDFLKVWVSLEQKYLKGKIPCSLHFALMPGKFTRELYLPSDKCSEEELGKMIGEYIKSFDDIMKQYFADNNAARAEKSYVERLKNRKYLV